MLLGEPYTAKDTTRVESSHPATGVIMASTSKPLFPASTACPLCRLFWARSDSQAYTWFPRCDRESTRHLTGSVHARILPIHMGVLQGSGHGWSCTEKVWGVATSCRDMVRPLSFIPKDLTPEILGYFCYFGSLNSKKYRFAFVTFRKHIWLI